MQGQFQLYIDVIDSDSFLEGADDKVDDLTKDITISAGVNTTIVMTGSRPFQPSTFTFSIKITCAPNWAGALCNLGKLYVV